MRNENKNFKIKKKKKKGLKSAVRKTEQRKHKTSVGLERESSECREIEQGVAVTFIRRRLWYR